MSMAYGVTLVWHVTNVHLLPAAPAGFIYTRHKGWAKCESAFQAVGSQQSLFTPLSLFSCLRAGLELGRGIGRGQRLSRRAAEGMSTLCLRVRAVRPEFCVFQSLCPMTDYLDVSSVCR
ncbi:hypothetical protein LY76DRAFT_236379 [Colletotrichum caudatum]|nr:hypothetical protein LY76DRAFT_236379 [Colletotrichum caudatum]